MSQQDLKLGEDYETDEFGQIVFTRKFHLKRGYCCKSGCRHCPYGEANSETPEELKKEINAKENEYTQYLDGDDWQEL